MLLTSLQSDVARPHLGRIELACRVGMADIRAHVMQVMKELAKEAEVPGFRKGKAPLKRVQAHYIKDVRARALGRLVESIQKAAREQVGKKYRVLGSPKPEYDKDARLDELASFEVQLAYDIDPMSDDLRIRSVDFSPHYRIAPDVETKVSTPSGGGAFQPRSELKGWALRPAVWIPDVGRQRVCRLYRFGRNTIGAVQARALHYIAGLVSPAYS